MKYKQLETLDYADVNNWLGEIIFNGQTSGSFRKANSKEGWVDTWIIYGLTKQQFPNYLRNEKGSPIVTRLYGKVEIFALDKQGKRIEEKEE